jgi:ATP/ADP translocase/HEAT repeat protein
MPERLSRLLQVRPGEWALMLLALAFAFASVAETVLIRIWADAMLLTVFDASVLPAFFVGSSLAFMVVSLVYASALGRGSAATLNIWILGSAALLTLAARPLIGEFGRPLVFGLCLTLTVAAPLVRILCWNAITECFDTRQAKRLLPIAGAGSTVGAILAGLFAEPFVRALGADDLLWVIAFAFVAMTPMPRLLARRGAALVPGRFRAQPTIEVAKEDYLRTTVLGFSTLRRNQLVGTVGALLFLGAIVTCFVEYSFKTALQVTYTRDDMAVFLGRFHAAVNTLILLAQLFVVGRVLARYTARFVFALLPTVLLAGATVLGADPVFWVIVGLHFADVLLRYTFQNSATEMVLSPVALLERNRAKVVIKGVMVPAGGLCAGLLLIPLREFFPESDDAWRAASWGCIIAVFVWLVLVLRIKRFYMEELRSALGFGRIVLSQTPEVRAVVEGGALQDLLGRIERGDPKLLAFYVELLARDAFALAEAEAVLDHPSARVRAAVYAAIGTNQLVRQRKALAQRLEHESDAAATRAGLRALRELGGPRDTLVAERFAAHAAAGVRAEALALLHQSGGAEGRARARSELETWMMGDRAERELAAYLIGEIAGPLGQPHAGAGPNPIALLADDGAPDEAEPAPWDLAALGALLSDGEASVREAAYRAIGRARIEAYLDRLVQAVVVRGEAATAIEALAQMGPSAAQALGRAYRSRATPRRLRLAIVQALGSVPVAASALTLLEVLKDGDAEARRLAVRSLHRLRGRVSARGFVQARLVEALQRELKRVHLYVGLAAEARRAKLHPFFVDEVERREGAARTAIFDLLGLLYEPKTMRGLHRRYRLGPGFVRANTVELLENVVEPDLRQPLTRAIEDTAPAEREARARAAWSLGPEGSFLDTLLEATEDRWLQRCLFYVSGQELAIRFTSRVREVREMVPLIERVIVLKSVPLFAELSGESLYPIAEIADDLAVPQGTVIFERGDVGNYLYVVVRGEVEIQRDGDVVRSLGSSEAFGEMAVLDDRPRSATAVAKTDAQLLRIEGEPFGDLLDQHPEIARGIIRVLLAYVRGEPVKSTAV